jgi:hypothetical protein
MGGIPLHRWRLGVPTLCAIGLLALAGCGGGAPPGVKEASPEQRRQRLHEEEETDTIDIKKKLLEHH